MIFAILALVAVVFLLGWIVDYHLTYMRRTLIRIAERLEAKP